MKKYYVYIMSSHSRVLYIGVTNSLRRRSFEHQQGLIDGFSKKYRTKYLVYFEDYSDIDVALTREKQLKKWSRKKKIVLIKQLNPDWDDLSKKFGFSVIK